MENKDSYLETSKAERSMWLMKCPALVSRSFKTPQPSSISTSSSPPTPQAVAKVILSIDPRVSNDDNDSSSPQFTMELVGTEIGDVPKRYSMEMSKDLVPMSVFSESSQGWRFLTLRNIVALMFMNSSCLAGKLSVEGKILNKFDMRPHDENIENYGKLCRERTNKYMTKSRQIQVIDNDNGTHMRPMPGMMIATVFNEKKKTPTKTSETKRTRRDRGEMEDIMFKLFERQPNWTLRQLIQETDQPERIRVCHTFFHQSWYLKDELLLALSINATSLIFVGYTTYLQFLKDILKDLCVYNNKGTNQGSYELKPEYKKASNDTNP
ncbi:hypothetical protein SCA6_000491 [Theobroma cacao]